MTKSNPVTVSKQSEVEIDKELLEQTALAIYLKLSESRMRGYNPQAIAQRAFAEARAFVRVTQGIRDGETVAEPTAETPAWVKVRLWDGSRGTHGEPQLDASGQPATEVLPADRYAFAPNLPDDHPINQRFYPNALRNGALVTRDGAPATN